MICANKNTDSLIAVSIYAGLELAVILILTRTFNQAVFEDWLLFYSLFFICDRVYQGFYGATLVRFLSGAKSEEHHRELTGSGWATALAGTVLISMLIYMVYFSLRGFNLKQGFTLFFVYYPLISFIRIPLLISLSLLQVKGEFKKIIVLRLFGMGLFVSVKNFY